MHLQKLKVSLIKPFSIENGFDGFTFMRFTRDNLKHIFPTEFLTGKKIWDFFEYMVIKNISTSKVLSFYNELYLQLM